MSEPQLSIRSTKARDLAHSLARRTGQPINKLVEQALEHYDAELRQQTTRYPMDTSLGSGGRGPARGAARHNVRA